MPFDSKKTSGESPLKEQIIIQTASDLNDMSLENLDVTNDKLSKLGQNFLYRDYQEYSALTNDELYDKVISNLNYKFAYKDSSKLMSLLLKLKENTSL